jgi:L-fucose isomerase
MAKVGILTFSDGRGFVAKELEKMNKGFQDRLVKRLRADGHTVVTGEIVWTNVLAKSEATKLATAGCDCTIFNYAVWAFPHFTTIASQFAPKPILAFGCINPKFPGMVGLLASVGALNQIGVRTTRVFGEIEEQAVYTKVAQFVRGAYASNKLKGETFGYFGGRPMGMYTAASNTDQWMAEFGIDIEHIDQWEIVRRSGRISPARVNKAFDYLTAQLGDRILYDGKQLTPEILRRQIRSYYAVLDMCREMHLDFCGIKGQPELTNSFCTMDVAEAFLNDPYSPEGKPKKPLVCSTEADMDAALTMEIMKHIAQTPVLFADVRHYFEKEGVFDFVNSGEHATYFAARSFDPVENLKHVRFFPESFYFPAGGAAVHHLAAPGKATFARLTRLDGAYWMAIIRGEIVRFADKKNRAMMEATQIEWPHCFVKLECSAEAFLQNYAANHIHAVYGDYVEELRHVCRNLDIEPVVFA